VAFGEDATKPATVEAVLHGEPASGSMRHYRGTRLPAV
jgi:hypothetical protein